MGRRERTVGAHQRGRRTACGGDAGSSDEAGDKGEGGVCDDEAGGRDVVLMAGGVVRGSRGGPSVDVKCMGGPRAGQC